MIIRVVKLTLDPKRSDEFLNLFKTFQPRIENSEGCVDVKALRDINNNGVFFTISTWHSEENLNNYRHSEVFNAIWPTVKKWMTAKPEAWSLSE